MTEVQELERLIDIPALQVAARKEWDRRKAATRYLEQPFLWLKYVCTDPDKRETINTALHGGGLRLVNSPKRRKIILWPRGHHKSSTLTIAEALRRAVKNPNIRILISSAKHDNAKGFLREIKNILRKKDFIELYGDLLPGPNDKVFANNEAFLSLTTKTSNFTQATFTTTGLDAEKTSQHYDLIIHDDVVARDNIGNEQMMMKVIQYYKDTVSLLDPKREMWVIGTRWHPLDLYGWILDSADLRCREADFRPHHPQCECKWEISVRCVIEDGKYIFPEKFDDETLAEMIEIDQLDRYTVACQYYNNPIDASTCWFKSSDIDAALIEPNEIRSYLGKDGKMVPRSLQWFAAIDPAESTDNRACLSAAVCVGVDTEDGTWYVDWAEGRRVETGGFIDLCMETYRRYKPRFGMEHNTRKSLAYILKKHMLETGELFNIEELKPQKVGDAKRTKVERIKRLVPLFEHRKIRINKTLKMLLGELYTIPASTSQDLCDALSYIFDMVPPGLGYKNKTAHKLPKRVIGWKGCGY